MREWRNGLDAVNTNKIILRWWKSVAGIKIVGSSPTSQIELFLIHKTTTIMSKKITDFLKTERPKDELAVTLAVIKEFKSNESTEEWLQITFAAWAKLEQLEEFLEHLVNDKPLADDTIEYINS